MNAIISREVSANDPQGEVLVVQWDNMEQEAQGIAHLIHERVPLESLTPDGFWFWLRDANLVTAYEKLSMAKIFLLTVFFTKKRSKEIQRF